MKRKRKFRRGIATIMAFLMAFSSIDFTSLAAPAYGGPDFGAIEEDFDYNRAKMLGGDRVYSLNHNAYKAFRSFRSVEFTEYTDANGPYFEFSYPYNCEADIVVYQLDTLLTNTSVYEGGYPATKEMLKEENKLGIVKGILLENPSGLTQAQVEQRLRSMTGPGEELKEVKIFGSSGKNARYYTLEDYYRVNGIMPEVMEDEEIENAEIDVEEEILSEKNQPDTDMEDSTEQPEKTDLDVDAGSGSVSDGDVQELSFYSVRALQNEEGLTVSGNTPVLSESEETPPVIQPEEEVEEPPFTEQPEEVEERFEEETQTMENKVLSDTVLPEDFYIMDTTSFAEENGIALFSMELPGNITHNYLRWDGTYITEGGAEEKLPTTPGSYLMVIEPSESSKSLEKQVSILPFNVGIAGGSSGSEADVENLFRKMFADHMAFRLTAYARSIDPVDLVTGSLLWEYTDLKLEGSQELEFTRFYDSTQADEKMGLGYGWSHNYDYALDTFYGTVMIRTPHGYTHEFVRDYSGAYVTAPGSSYSLESGNGIYTLKNTDGTQIVFNEDGIPTEITDILGRKTVFENDGTHITKASNQAGSFQFAYQGEVLSSVTDSAGRTVDFTYAGEDLASASNPDGDLMSFSYDGSHNLLTVTGFTGEILQTNTYNGSHQVIHQDIPDLGGFDYTYLEEERTTTLTTDGGLTQTVQYDDKYRVISDSNQAGTYFYTYDEYSRKTSETDRNGNVTSYEYAQDTGNISTIHYPDGTSEAYTYNGKNQVTSVTQRDGSVIQYTYDERGNLTGMTDGSGRVTAYTYDGNANLTGITDGEGRTTSFTYDSFGRMVSSTDPAGNTSLYEYDGAGRITKEISPEGNTTVYTYTPAGKLASETDSLGNTITYEYTGNGYVARCTDKNGNTSSVVYSALSNLLAYTDREGNTTTYTVDCSGNTASVTDAEGNSIHYTYDGLGQMIAATDAKGNTVRYTYDGNGNLIAMVTAEGCESVWGYDSMNRLRTSVDANGSEIRYQYDSMGRIGAVTDGEGYTSGYSYDASGNLLRVTNRRGYETSYTYDAANQITGEKDALGGVTSYEYDASGRLVKITRPDGTCIQNLYDADGNMVAAVDGAGEKSVYTYDGNGQLLAAESALGQSESYQYDRNGNLIAYTNAAGNTASYTYDKEDRLISQTDMAGNITTYAYYKNGWLKEETDALDQKTVYTYDAGGNVTAVTDPMGYELRYTYDRDNRVTAVTDKNGNRTVYTYDGNGNILTKTNSDGGVESYTYDKKNQMISHTDAEGGTMFFEYDGNGNLTAVTDALGAKATAEYDALDRLIGTTDAEGNEIALALDSMGRILKVIDEDGAETGYTYDAAGRVIAVTDALGGEKTYTYDADGNVLTETDENGITRSYEYDVLGNVTAFTDGKGNSMHYAYDKNGNLIRVTDKNGGETSYTYDTLGRVLTETDALGNTRTFTYDKNGRITAVTDKRGYTVTYELDGNGNIICQTDEAGHPSYFEYDSMNRLVKTILYSDESTDESGNRVMEGEQITLYTYDKRGLNTTVINAKGDSCIYQYDALGNCIRKTDEDGFVTEYEYNALGRMVKTDYNHTKTASFVYSGSGQLIRMEDWNGITSFEYDALNRLTKVTDFNNRTTAYEYDAAGNQTGLIYPNGQKVVLSYDEENCQTQVTDPEGQIFSFTYDANGNSLSKRFPNGEMERYQYDANNQRIRMDEYNKDGVQKTYTEYTYDENGNRTSDKNRVPTTPVKNWEETSNTGTWGGEWNVYTYDSCNRLIMEQEMDTSLTITYGYDFLGNKILEKDSRDHLRYTYNELNQLVAKEAYNRTTNYEYDKRGNRVLETSIHTQENRRTYEWDETNHLVSGTRGPDWGLYTSTYTYNGLGKRVNSTIMGPDKTVYDRDYVIDYTSAEFNDLVEYNEGHYQWQGDKPVHELYHLYNAAGERVQVTTDRFSQWGGENILYKRNVHEDIMGSAAYYTQQDTGYIKNKHEYSTWGNNTKAPTYNYDPEYRSTEPYYTGHPYDGSLNLYYAEARFYDPETGSWLSKDPAGIAGGMNLYQYCNSNPTSYVDVTGEEPITLTTALLLIAAGIIVYEVLDATVFNPNVNAMHPVHRLPHAPGGYVPEVLPKTDFSFPTITRDKPLIIPGPSVESSLVGALIEVFPYIVVGVETYIEIFPAIERDFFQNIVCTESKSGTDVNITFPQGEAQLKHIFRDAEGHITDTPANRQKILDITNNLDNHLGKDARGNDWYAAISEDGTQTWVRVRNGVIDNAGVNAVPRTWDSETGLYNNTKK